MPRSTGAAPTTTSPTCASTAPSVTGADRRGDVDDQGDAVLRHLRGQLAALGSGDAERDLHAPLDLRDVRGERRLRIARERHAQRPAPGRPEARRVDDEARATRAVGRPTTELYGRLVREDEREAGLRLRRAVVLHERGGFEGDLGRIERDDVRGRIEAQHETLSRQVEREIRVGRVDESRPSPREVREVAIGDELRAEAETPALVGDRLDVGRVRRPYDSDAVGGRRSVCAPVACPRRAQTFDHVGVTRIALAGDVDGDLLRGQRLSGVVDEGATEDELTLIARSASDDLRGSAHVDANAVGVRGCAQRETERPRREREDEGPPEKKVGNDGAVQGSRGRVSRRT